MAKPRVVVENRRIVVTNEGIIIEWHGGELDSPNCGLLFIRFIEDDKKFFRQFFLPVPQSEKAAGSNGRMTCLTRQPAGSRHLRTAVLRVCRGLSSPWSAPAIPRSHSVSVFHHPCERLLTGLPATFSGPVNVFVHLCQRLSPRLSVPPLPLVRTFLHAASVFAPRCHRRFHPLSVPDSPPKRR